MITPLRFGQVIRVDNCPGDFWAWERSKKNKNSKHPSQSAIESVIENYPRPTRVAFNIPNSFILTDEDSKTQMTDEMRKTDLCIKYADLIKPDNGWTKLKRTLLGQKTNDFLVQYLDHNPPGWWNTLKARWTKSA